MTTDKQNEDDTSDVTEADTSGVSAADIENAMATYSGEGQSDDAAGGSSGDEQLQSQEEIDNTDGMPHGHS